MTCLYAEYSRGFREARAAIAGEDAAALGALGIGLSKLDPKARLAAVQGFKDAVMGRPPRAHVHFCRMHRRPDCPGRVEAVA